MCTLRILEVELFVYPLLALLEYGFALPIQSSFSLDLPISYFLIASAFTFNGNKLYFPPLSGLYLSFFLSLSLRVLYWVSLILLFFPIYFIFDACFMISYGKHFGISLYSNAHSHARFYRVPSRFFSTLLSV